MTPQSLVVFKSCFKPGIPLTARWASHTASISLENHLFQSWGPVTGAEMGNEALKPPLKSTFSHIVAQATEHSTHLQPGHVWQGKGVLQTSTPSDPLGPDWEPGTTEEGRLGSNCDQSKVPREPRAAAGKGGGQAALQGSGARVSQDGALQSLEMPPVPSRTAGKQGKLGKEEGMQRNESVL